MERLLKTGPGWRLGWWPEAPEFKALVGGEDWAIELTEVEFQDFCRLVDRLLTALTQIAEELMDEERIACEAESEHIWLEAEGYPHVFSLHLLVLTGRRVEGKWPPEVLPGLLQAIQTLQVF